MRNTAVYFVLIQFLNYFFSFTSTRVRIQLPIKPGGQILIGSYLPYLRLESCGSYTSIGPYLPFLCLYYSMFQGAFQ